MPNETSTHEVATQTVAADPRPAPAAQSEGAPASAQHRAEDEGKPSQVHPEGR